MENIFTVMRSLAILILIGNPSTKWQQVNVVFAPLYHVTIFQFWRQSNANEKKQTVKNREGNNTRL